MKQLTSTLFWQIPPCAVLWPEEQGMTHQPEPSWRCESGHPRTFYTVRWEHHWSCLGYVVGSYLKSEITSNWSRNTYGSQMLPPGQNDNCKSVISKLTGVISAAKLIKEQLKDLNPSKRNIHTNAEHQRPEQSFCVVCNHWLETPYACISAEVYEAREKMAGTAHCTFLWEL